MYIKFIKSEGNLIMGDKMFKWNGKKFTCYEWDEGTGSWVLVGESVKPVVKDLGLHKIAIYMKKDYTGSEVGVRVMVYSEYKRQNDYVDYPIMYDNDEVAWNYPECVPKYVQYEVKKLMKKLREEGVL